MYFLWAILPLILLVMAIWAWLKPILKVYGKEDGKRYFMMFLFCAFIMWLSIMIDQTEMFKELIPKLSFGFLEYNMVRWLTYPAMLYLAGTAWDAYDKKKKK